MLSLLFFWQAHHEYVRLTSLRMRLMTELEFRYCVSGGGREQHEAHFVQWVDLIHVVQQDFPGDDGDGRNDDADGGPDPRVLGLQSDFGSP